MAAIEYAVLGLQVEHIIVCGHSLPNHPHRLRRCSGRGGGPEGLAQAGRRSPAAGVPQPRALAPHRAACRGAATGAPTMDYLWCAARRGRPPHPARLALCHRAGRGVHVFDAVRGAFIPASQASHSGTGLHRLWNTMDSEFWSTTNGLSPDTLGALMEARQTVRPRAGWPAPCPAWPRLQHWLAQCRISARPRAQPPLALCAGAQSLRSALGAASPRPCWNATPPPTPNSRNAPTTRLCARPC